MRLFALAIYEEYELTVELFSERAGAEKYVLELLWELFGKGSEVPAVYDTAEISDFVCSVGASLVWTITEHDDYVDSGKRISL